VTREVLGRSGASSAPSHLLFDGRAIPLLSSSLVVGRSPGPGQALALPEGLAGVSGRHWWLVRGGSEVVLVDHSYYGTFVNGERVSERVRIHAGDKVRLGEPGGGVSLLSFGQSA